MRKINYKKKLNSKKKDYKKLLKKYKYSEKKSHNINDSDTVTETDTDTETDNTNDNNDRDRNSDNDNDRDNNDNGNNGNTRRDSDHDSNTDQSSRKSSSKRDSDRSRTRRSGNTSRYYGRRYKGNIELHNGYNTDTEIILNRISMIPNKTQVNGKQANYKISYKNYKMDYENNSHDIDNLNNNNTNDTNNNQQLFNMMSSKQTNNSQSNYQIENQKIINEYKIEIQQFRNLNEQEKTVKYIQEKHINMTLMDKYITLQNEYSAQTNTHNELSIDYSKLIETLKIFKNNIVQWNKPTIDEKIIEKHKLDTKLKPNNKTPKLTRYVEND